MYTDQYTNVLSQYRGINERVVLCKSTRLNDYNRPYRGNQRYRIYTAPTLIYIISAFYRRSVILEHIRYREGGEWGRNGDFLNI